VSKQAARPFCRPVAAKVLFRQFERSTIGAREADKSKASADLHPAAVFLQSGPEDPPARRKNFQKIPTGRIEQSVCLLKTAC
jgi:hypothetical protein